MLKVFLIEAASEDKLTHLEHAEDHVINGGMEGFAHAYHNLQDVHDQLHGTHNKTRITTKYDGSPSIVFGHNPENGKFFVASKSAFNKNPKLNYTPEDIEHNHGHAQGLVDKLKQALTHLPKVTPKKGVYQGDVMHSGIKSKSNPSGDVVDKGGRYYFKPNTISYSTPHGSEEGKKMASSKFGVAVHTAYHGKTFESMKPEYGADLSHFGEHKDVHLISAAEEVPKARLSTDQEHTYQHHLQAAKDAFVKTHKNDYGVLQGHQEPLKTYINSTVRTGTKPSVEGYVEHLKNRGVKEIAKVKTHAAIARKTEAMQNDIDHVKTNKNSFGRILDMHHHLQAAKDQLVNSLSNKPKFEHHIPSPGSTDITQGTKAKPEGFVVVRNNRPTKFVDRAEFSRANFAARPR